MEGNTTAANLANLAEDIKVISANGNLILHVNPQNQNSLSSDHNHAGNQHLAVHKPKLLVSSTYLSRGSPVFRGLFEPLFRNRQASEAANAPLELTLEDDQRGAITDLCILLHGGSPPDLFAMSCSSRILAFAKAAHKYGCASYFSFHAQALLYQALHDSGFADDLSQTLHEIAAAAYLFRNARLFDLATARLVTEAGFETGDAQVIACVPKEVWHAIEIKRQVAGFQFTHHVPALCIKPCLHCNFDCGPYLAQLAATFELAYWAAPRLTVDDALFKMERLVGWWIAGCQCGPLLGQVSQDAVKELQDKVKEGCSGVCLKCVQEKRDLVQQCTFPTHQIRRRFEDNAAARACQVRTDALKSRDNSIDHSHCIFEKGNA